MTNGNDAAFAKATVYGPDEDHPTIGATYEQGEDGLTKREYFAAMAMQGLADRDWSWDATADEAVQAADALIARLNTSGNPATASVDAENQQAETEPRD